MSKSNNNAKCIICGRELKLPPVVNFICAKCCKRVRSKNAVIIKDYEKYRIVSNERYRMLREKMLI